MPAPRREDYGSYQEWANAFMDWYKAQASGVSGGDVSTEGMTEKEKLGYDLRTKFATGDFTPTDLANWFHIGGSAQELATMMQLGAGGMGLRQQAQQEALQPLRMQLIKEMVGQVGEPGFQPYATTPSKLPMLPGIPREFAGTVGSTPTGGPGLTTPSFADMRSRLAAALGGVGPPTTTETPTIGGGVTPPTGPAPPALPTFPGGDIGQDPCAGLTGEALRKCREKNLPTRPV